MASVVLREDIREILWMGAVVPLGSQESTCFSKFGREVGQDAMGTIELTAVAVPVPVYGVRAIEHRQNH